MSCSTFTARDSTHLQPLSTRIACGVAVSCVAIVPPRSDLKGDVLAERNVDELAELLHDTGETHHIVYKIVDGDDPHWASGYADWLIHLPAPPPGLGTPPVRP